MEFNFNTRAQYLAQVAEWKAEYAAWAWEIRGAKHRIKEAQIALSKLGRLCRENSKEFWTAMIAVQHALNDRASGSAKATKMIEARRAAKIEAQRQYLSTRG